jgi:alkanesulfonate monooxygenase SsuD/methylene tetrahydromethanopterin reductase-like flavin-dependent oxidoreductase (luciferase family)
MGMPKGKPVAKLIETIDLLRQWFQPPYAATSPGQATEFGMSNWRRVIHPIQAHLPIYLAAVGPQALRVAAHHADGVIFNDLASHDFIREAIQTVRSEAKAAGRDASQLEFYVRAQIRVTDDPEAVYEQRKGTVALIHALPGMEPLLKTEGFDTERIIADVRQAMNTNSILDQGGGFPDLREGGNMEQARRAIPLDLMRELTVAGPPADIRKRLREFQDIGVTHVFIAALPKTATVESVAETIAAIT